MALLMDRNGLLPAGQYNIISNFAPKGGEVGIIISTGTDADGNQILAARAATTGDSGPYYLIDDGLKSYGLDVGNTVARTSTGFTSGADSGVRLGPPTYNGSGKLTLWDYPGTYGITLDSLVDTESALKAAVPNAPMTVDPATGRLKLGLPSGGQPIAFAIGFGIDPALVTTGGSPMNGKRLIIRFNPLGGGTI